MNITSTYNSGATSLKMVIFGESGVGKTTLASTLKEPTLVISAEAGLLSLAHAKIDVIDISMNDQGAILAPELRIARLGEVYTYLITPEARAKYKWIFIDSITEISQNLVAQLQKEFPDRKDSLVLYGENAKRMKSLVKSFRDLPYYNVVFTALSSVEKDENGQRFTGIDVIGKLSSTLPSYFDEVFYLHSDGEGKRTLVTEKSEKLVAKDRSGKLNKLEPADLSVIVSKIRGEKKSA
jgi:hypothetical protein